MVEYVKGKIRVYQRNIKRKLKDGKTKTYQTHQQQVTLDKNDILVDGETVAVVPLETFKTYIESTSTNKNQLQELTQVQKKYKDITETNQELTNDIKRLRNSKDHTQERLTKALEEINQQQKVISDLSNRGFFDYVTGKLPESYKQLQAPPEKPD
jgi:chromosome segregation ATPase